MKHLRSFIAVCLFLLHPALSVGAEESINPPITVNIPEIVIADALKEVLPLTLEADSQKLQGKITIVDISGFKLYNKVIFAHLELTGEDLQVVTTVADQTIRLNLGSAGVDFDCEASLRFDDTQQTLFVKVLAQGLDAEKTLESGEIGEALLLFLNGREFPVNLSELQPLYAETDDKLITVSTKIDDIRTAAGVLQISLLPTVRAEQKQ